MGVEFNEAEVADNQLSKFATSDELADFVVVMDGIYRNVLILTQPLDEDICEKIVLNYIALHVSLGVGDNLGMTIILTFCENDNWVLLSAGSLAHTIQMYSLKGICLD